MTVKFPKVDVRVSMVAFRVVVASDRVHGYDLL